MLDLWHHVIPWRGKPKARPRVTSKGTFMPRDYREWKENVAEDIRLAAQGMKWEGPVKLILGFGSDEVRLLIVDLGDKKRPKYVRADIDNLVGGVMDALQLSGVIDDDKQVVEIHAFAYKEE